MLLTWIVGLVTGILVVRSYWHGFLITGNHGKFGLAMVPFILFGLFSGLYMDHFKKRRKILPALHGLNNVIVLALAVNQAVLGWDVYNVYVLGN